MSGVAVTASAVANVAVAALVLVLVGLVLTQEILRARDEYAFWTRGLNFFVYPLTLLFGVVVVARLTAIAF